MAKNNANEIDVYIGKQIRIRRRELKITLLQMAIDCKVSYQQIQKYEGGANRISASRLWEIAKILEVPVDYFFTGLNNDKYDCFPLAGAVSELTQLHKLGKISDAKLTKSLNYIILRLAKGYDIERSGE